MRNPARLPVCATEIAAIPPCAEATRAVELNSARLPKARVSRRLFSAACGLVVLCAALGTIFGGLQRGRMPAPAPMFLKDTSILSDRPALPTRPIAWPSGAAKVIGDRVSLVLAADTEATAAPVFLGETVLQAADDLPSADDVGPPDKQPELAAVDNAGAEAEHESGPPRAIDGDAAAQSSKPHVAALPPTSDDTPLAPSHASRQALNPLAAETIRLSRERAENRLQIGDIFGMRLFLERAARLGSSEAQLRLAQSYDETYLAAWGARGVRPDPALAAALYEEANAARAVTQGR